MSGDGAPALNLPEELWFQIFSFFSVIDTVTDSSLTRYTSAPSHDQLEDEERRIIAESLAVKYALSLVSRQFYHVCRPLLLELVSVRTFDHLHSLASALEKDSTGALGSVMTRWTRRLDICLDPRNKFSGPEAERRLYRYFETITRSCRALSFLTCQFDLCLDPWCDISLDRLIGACSPLEVLRLQSTTITMFPRCSGLRVLDLLMYKPRTPIHGVGISEFPYLHTISGLLEVICPAFATTLLPSLHTLICDHHGNFFVEYLSSFFENHGKKIQHLDHRFDPIPEESYLTLCPNVVNLVISWSHTAMLYFRFHNVTHVSLAGTITSGVQAMRMSLYVFDIFQLELEAANFPKLRTIRILERASIQRLLRYSLHALLLYDRKLRGWSVQLEDSSGERLIQLA